MSSPAGPTGRLRSAGVIVLLVGAWGALVPFVGPTFGYDMGGGPAWAWTESHATLHLLPGIAAVLGGALLARNDRAINRVGAGLAALGGIWFVIGPSLHPLWAGQTMGGMSMGDSALSSALSSLGYHYGTGAVIAVVAAYAWGVLSGSRSADESFDSARREETLPTGGTSLVGTRR